MQRGSGQNKPKGAKRARPNDVHLALVVLVGMPSNPQVSNHGAHVWDGGKQEHHHADGLEVGNLEVEDVRAQVG